MKKAPLLASTALLSTIAGAQSINIDFNWNGFGTIPTNSYAAAGLAGVWNSANVSTNSIINFGLQDLSGAATTALITIANFGGNCATSGPWSGNDESLMEDLAGSGSNAAQMAFTGLLTGTYRVTLYGMNSTGNSNSSFTINNVTQTTGGAWTGAHVAGASYTTFSGVGVSGGSLNVSFLGNVNGVQLDYNPVPEPASLAVVFVGLGLIAFRRRLP